jgi:hypothetical protein
VVLQVVTDDLSGGTIPFFAQAEETQPRESRGLFQAFGLMSGLLASSTDLQAVPTRTLPSETDGDLVSQANLQKNMILK